MEHASDDEGIAIQLKARCSLSFGSGLCSHPLLSVDDKLTMVDTQALWILKSLISALGI